MNTHHPADLPTSPPVPQTSNNVIVFPDLEWDRETDMPPLQHRTIRACAGNCDGCRFFTGLITEAILLARRHGSVRAAARLMGMSEPGLRGLLTRPREMPRFEPAAPAGRKSDRRPPVWTPNLCMFGEHTKAAPPASTAPVVCMPDNG